MGYDVLSHFAVEVNGVNCVFSVKGQWFLVEKFMVLQLSSPGMTKCDKI
jgi:hypothetical protein